MGESERPPAVECTIAPAETYDMIVQPLQETYAIFAETMDRKGIRGGNV